MHSETIGMRAVQTIPATAPIHAAAEMMARESAGSLVALDGDGRATGILTDRDLVLRCLSRVVDLESTCVADVMTTTFVSAGPDEELAQLIERMRDKGVRRIPICIDGRPVGMVALDDAIQVLARELSSLGTGARARAR